MVSPERRKQLEDKIRELEALKAKLQEEEKSHDVPPLRPAAALGPSHMAEPPLPPPTARMNGIVATGIAASPPRLPAPMLPPPPIRSAPSAPTNVAAAPPRLPEPALPPPPPAKTAAPPIRVVEAPPSSAGKTPPPRLPEPTLPRPAAAGSNKLTSRETTSNGTVLPSWIPSPTPTVVINGMQTGVQGTGGAGYAATSTCSTITANGVSGSGPANCGSAGTSQFPGLSGMATPGKTYSTRPYYNRSGWRFNPATGFWQNPNNASETNIPTLIICCDETGLGFPGDAVNLPAENSAAADNNSGGCKLPPARLKQLLGYMAEVAKRTHEYPSEISRAIRKLGGSDCGVPTDFTCLRALVTRKPAPLGCPPNRYNQNSDEQADAGTDAGATTPVPQPSPTVGDAPPPMTDYDEVYCNFMASAIVRGELTPGPATAIPAGCNATIAAAKELRAKGQAEGAPPPFTMDPAQTAEQVKRLQTPLDH